MPKLGNPAAKIALPHPPKTSQNVPNNSAKYFFICIFFNILVLIYDPKKVKRSRYKFVNIIFINKVICIFALQNLKT